MVAVSSYAATSVAASPFFLPQPFSFLLFSLSLSLPGLGPQALLMSLIVRCGPS